MAWKEKSIQSTQITQNVTGHYIDKRRLKELLERLFPQQVEFDIRVGLCALLFVGRPADTGAFCR